MWAAGARFQMDDSTRTLIRDASLGDRLAVDQLLARYLPELRGFIRLRTGPAIRDKEGISDLAQSLCREVLENADRVEFDSERAFKHWLYTKALRLIQNRAKFWAREKRDVRREVALEDPRVRCYASIGSPSVQLRSTEDLARIEATFDRMSDDHREVITLSRVLGLTHAEIAEKMGRSEAAARQLLHRALSVFALLLEADESASREGHRDDPR